MWFPYMKYITVCRKFISNILHGYAPNCIHPNVKDKHCLKCWGHRHRHSNLVWMPAVFKHCTSSSCHTKIMIQDRMSMIFQTQQSLGLLTVLVVVVPTLRFLKSCGEPPYWPAICFLTSAATVLQVEKTQVEKREWVNTCMCNDPHTRHNWLSFIYSWESQGVVSQYNALT